ncbi:hypothetical protein FRB94_005061 [Tulasnella sp. JGI-2019a]|nr:hypothetical protein FRB94_005061 [Tulasnella sp. JGI-2019a]
MTGSPTSCRVASLARHLDGTQRSHPMSKEIGALLEQALFENWPTLTTAVESPVDLPSVKLDTQPSNEPIISPTTYQLEVPGCSTFLTAYIKIVMEDPTVTIYTADGDRRRTKDLRRLRRPLYVGNGGLGSQNVVDKEAEALVVDLRATSEPCRFRLESHEQKDIFIGYYVNGGIGKRNPSNMEFDHLWPQFQINYTWTVSSDGTLHAISDGKRLKAVLHAVKNSSNCIEGHNMRRYAYFGMVDHPVIIGFAATRVRLVLEPRSI